MPRKPIGERKGRIFLMYVGNGAADAKRTY